ncbi:heterokaryon incompatibility protein-domain-containing protein, partial [Boeremia exigua]|uniref:heterokaryon incompatibility protein-domain-containing protein n=1 Tax=Boeremia exigua TaxID=749465 RepID=UPI001E8E8604
MQRTCDGPSSNTILTSELSAIYKDHPLSPSTTRVLQINPSKHSNDPISCCLSVISLNPAPKYRAASYTWGDPSATKVIFVDNRPFRVRVNLWNFISQMREDRYLGLVWIDAICINQDDLQERSEQVAIMGQIYSKATEVRAWLGVATANITKAMGKLADTDWRAASEQRKQRLITSNEYLLPIIDLCNLEYWSRIWIVQECTLA